MEYFAYFFIATICIYYIGRLLKQPKNNAPTQQSVQPKPFSGDYKPSNNYARNTNQSSDIKKSRRSTDQLLSSHPHRDQLQGLVDLLKVARQYQDNSDMNMARVHFQKVGYCNAEIEIGPLKSAIIKEQSLFVQQDPTYQSLIKSTLDILDKVDGIKQTDLYPLLKANPEEIRYVLYFGEVLNEVKREKQGRSYWITSAYLSTDHPQSAYKQIIAGLVCDESIRHELGQSFLKSHDNGDPKKAHELIVNLLSGKDWDWPWLENNPEALKRRVSEVDKWGELLRCYRAPELKLWLKNRGISLPTKVKLRADVENFIRENIPWEEFSKELPANYKINKEDERLRILTQTLSSSLFRDRDWSKLLDSSRTGNVLKLIAVQVKHSGDNNSSSECQAINNTTLPIDHPWWKEHMLPHIPGCQCRMVGIRSKGQFERMGGAFTPDEKLYPLPFGVHQASNTVSN